VNSVFSQTGTITGIVYDANQETILNARVSIGQTEKIVLSDFDGVYLIEDVPVGLYNITCSSAGFQSNTQYEIEVKSNKTTTVNFILKDVADSLGEFTVKANPFEKKLENSTSSNTLGENEIVRFPGGNRDVSKVISSLPGVSPTVSFRNDIIIRGGAPSENRFYLDGIEVPNINHFATQGSSGGPVGLINVNFINRVDFFSSAFPSNYANGLSSVLVFNQKEGNPDKLAGTFTLGSSDVGLTFDGPLGEKSNFIFSVRRSYLQFLFQALKLPFLPTYNDYQLKFTHDFNKNNEISVISLGALDEFALNESANEGIEDSTQLRLNNYILNNIPVNEQWNYTFGVKWRNRFEGGFQDLIVSRNMLRNTSEKYQNNEASDPSNLILDYESDEIENKVRYERNTLKNGWKTKWGAGYQYAKYTNSTFNRIATPNGVQTVDFSSVLDLHKGSLFIQESKALFKDKLTLSLGLRSDFNNYNADMQNPLNQLSPRLGLSYQLSEKWKINSSVGRFYQLPSYTIMGFRNNSGELINKTTGLKYIGSDHYVIGLEKVNKNSSRFTIEGFYKNYFQYPFLLRDSISIANLGADFGVIGNEEVTSNSEGRSYGAEFLFQQKLYKGFYGLLAYTFVVSEFKDKNGVYTPSSWDSRHIVSLTGGKKFKNNWDFGFRWLFSGGSPYTPYDIESSRLISNWNVRGAGLLDYDELNSRRLNAFHQLDVRVDKRFYGEKFNLNLYLDIQNLYNFQAEQAPILLVQTQNGSPVVDPNDNSRYLTEEIANPSGTVLPTIGVIFEF
jgi:outer membrane receptor for ferrienterochelin and colicin